MQEEGDAVMKSLCSTEVGLLTCLFGSWHGCLVSPDSALGALVGPWGYTVKHGVRFCPPLGLMPRLGWELSAQVPLSPVTKACSQGDGNPWVEPALYRDGVALSHRRTIN